MVVSPKFARSSLLAAAFAAATALAGCAGDGLTSAGVATASTTPADGTAMTADVDISATPKPKAAFDPFSDPNATAVGGREVIVNPTREQVMLAGPLPEISVGRADAPHVLIKYMSLTCPYCRQFQLDIYPQLKRELIDTGQLRIIFREFPIGFQSGLATIALRCAAPDRQVQLYEKFLTQQSAWASQEVRPDPIAKVAAQVGVTREAFDACRKDPKLIEGLKWVKERGRTLGIVGTPNFFIDGRLVKKTVTLDEIKAMVAPAASVATR